MPSLYSSTPGNANVASKNFTTLYSGSGTINPQQAYGNANVVALLAVGTDGGNTVANITATGNVTAAYFIGNGSLLTNINAGNIVGNLAAAGANTQVQFNNAGVLGADSDFTFNSATSALAVTGNITGGNVVTSGTGLLVGNVFSTVAASTNAAVLTARMATDDTFRIAVGGTFDDGFVELATADNGDEPIYVRQYSDFFITPARTLTLLDAAGNTSIPGNTSVVGNVAAAYFIGNGSALTSITGANVIGNVGLAQFVTANAQANITSVGTLTSVSVSGNVTSGNVTSLANISAVGNITAGYFIGNGSQLTDVAVGAAGANTQVQFNDAGVTNGTAGFTFDKTSNAIVVVGNITGANINGNGSGLSSLTGANVTGTVANATYALNANAATFAGTVTTAAQPNITSVGTLTSVSVTGNVTAGNIINNGTITSTGNITAPNFFGNVQGNVTGNVTNALHANVADLANSVAGANVTGTVANAAYATAAGSATTAITANTVTDAAQANITSVGTLTSLSVSGNITSGNIINNGTITSIGNITAPNFIGNIGGNILAGGANTQVQFNDGSVLNGTAGMTFDKTSNALAVTGNVSGGNVTTVGLISATGNITGGNVTTVGLISATGNITGGNVTTVGLITATGNVDAGNLRTAGLITATGNINGANLVASANLTSTQQTIIGTANNGSTGNIVMSGKNIATDMAFLPDGGNAVTASRGRVVVGTGFDGNTAHSANQHRLFVNDSIQRTNTGTSVQLFAAETQVSLTGNVTNNSFRQQGVGARVRVGGGSAGNTIALTAAGAGQIGAVAALQPNIEVGNVAPYLLGNTSVSHATLNGGFFTTQSGGFIANAYGMLPGAVASSTGNASATGNITNYVGFASQLSASPFITGNLYAFYHGNVSGSAQQTAVGLATGQAARAATNYYAFRNDDPFAQVQLGSLRTFHEYQHSTSTSGTVNIDKLNAQVQYIAPTANVTIGDFQNFVFNVNNGASNVSLANIAQVDTVTLVIQQGATPYTVTMPTGNAAIKYAGNLTTVGSTANAATMISITGTKVGNAATAGTGLYLVTVSPEFV